jgi:hypothetical protein
MEKMISKPIIRKERIKKMDDETEVTKTPETIKLPNMRDMDIETIQLLVEDKIATGG